MKKNVHLAVMNFDRVTKALFVAMIGVFLMFRATELMPKISPVLIYCRSISKKKNEDINAKSIKYKNLSKKLKTKCIKIKIYRI